MRLPSLVLVVGDVPVGRPERDREFDRTEQLFRALFAQGDEQQAVAEVAGQLGRGLRPTVNFVLVGGVAQEQSGPVAPQWPKGSVARGHVYCYCEKCEREGLGSDRVVGYRSVLERRVNRGQA